MKKPFQPKKKPDDERRERRPETPAKESAEYMKNGGKVGKKSC